MEMGEARCPPTFCPVPWPLPFLQPVWLAPWSFLSLRGEGALCRSPWEEGLCWAESGQRAAAGGRAGVAGELRR